MSELRRKSCTSIPRAAEVRPLHSSVAARTTLPTVALALALITGCRTHHDGIAAAEDRDLPAVASASATATAPIDPVTAVASAESAKPVETVVAVSSLKPGGVEIADVPVAVLATTSLVKPPVLPKPPAPVTHPYIQPEPHPCPGKIAPLDP